MPSRLSIINDELLLAGHSPFNEPDDGSDAWNVCSAAYDAAVELCLDRHDWKFATIITTVAAYTDESDDADYAYEYLKPTGSLHVIWVRNTGGTAVDWKIVGNRILTDPDDGIVVKYVEEPDPDQWPGLFTAALRCFVRAGIYSGLSKDPVSARAERAQGELLLREARPRSDSEEPGRVKFVSGLRSARTTRRG